MVHQDFGADICYTGFSKKDFKKIIKQIEAFDGLNWCILFYDATAGGNEGTVLVHPIK